MPWQSLPPRLASAEMATITKEGVALSGRFIENQDLMEYEWIELFIDDTLRRIGFKFHDSQTVRTRKLTKSSKKGRFISGRELGNRKWLSDILDEAASDRRFLIETDDSIEIPDAHPLMLLYLIVLGPVGQQSFSVTP